MENKSFKEYRCFSCGKLLFKGRLLLSTVEVKCRRCRELRLYRQERRDGPVSFMLVLDKDGRLREASREAEYILSYPSNALFGKPIADICPGFRVADISQSLPYHIKANAFTLRDGGTISAETYVVRDNSDSVRLVNIVNPRETQ